jgi:hypothetical protein
MTDRSSSVADAGRGFPLFDRPEFWQVMIYACGGRPRTPLKPCGYETEFYLEVGCEGPRSAEDPWKTPEGKRVVPVPFCAGRCPQCGGDLLHDRWNEDRELIPRYVGPLELPHFAYPTPAEFKRLGMDACGKPVYRRGPVGG